MSCFDLKCAFAPSIHSSQILLSLNKVIFPSAPLHLQDLFNSNILPFPQTTQIKSFSTQICLCTLKSFKSSFFFSNSKVSLYTQITQIRPSSILICFFTLKSFTLGHLRLRCAFAPLNHLNQDLFNFHVPLHP